MSTTMENQGTNILEGEAIETDDENEYPSFVQNTMVAVETKTPSLDVPSSSVVVSGEAEESDEDTSNYITRSDYPSHSITQVEEDAFVTIESAKKPRFHSPFHKKLWENNFSFRLGVVQSKLDTNNHVINKLQSLVPSANRTLNYTQETLKHYRSISESTKGVYDQLEQLLQNTQLPNIILNPTSD